MPKTFHFPDVGEGITEGELVKWLVGEGDEVKVDSPGRDETDRPSSRCRPHTPGSS